MCGIWCCVGIVEQEKVNTCLETLEARGPEGSRVFRVWDNLPLGFTRLALNGLNDAGMQPMEHGKTTWVCNGEIQFDMGAPTNSVMERYHEIPWMKNPTINSVNVACTMVRECFIKAVKKRLMTDHSEIAVTLSGGLDSSLVAAIAAAEWREAGKGAIRTFSIGMEGSTDLFYARLVADHIGSIHTEIVKTPEEFFAAIPHVIRDIESFDTTTV